SPPRTRLFNNRLNPAQVPPPCQLFPLPLPVHCINRRKLQPALPLPPRLPFHHQFRRLTPGRLFHTSPHQQFRIHNQRLIRNLRHQTSRHPRRHHSQDSKLHQRQPQHPPRPHPAH